MTRAAIIVRRLANIAEQIEQVRAEAALMLPAPPTHERDVDGVEAALLGAPSEPWSCDSVARTAGIPTYRARAALRELIASGRVEARGRTKGMRYYLRGRG